MCFMPKAKQQKVPQEQKQPEPIANPDEVGEARIAENDALFGGVPDLRVDRSATGGGATSGGAGLKME